MKTIAAIIIVIAGVTSMNAQPIQRQSIEDSIIGWMKVYKYKGIKEPMQVDGKLYSAAQLSICDTLANWIQASYKIDPEIAELCKKDKPQWILVQWDYYPGDPAEKQQHDAIINNFNFEYVYNFFFAPEKVKGQPYKPSRDPADI